MSLLEAALFLSQQWPVFACGAEKRPVTPNGLKDATTDPAELRDQFRKAGAAMIGVPTGERSGFIVVDLDVKEGANGLEWLAANDHRLPRTRTHRTRSGGKHLLFSIPDGRAIRNSASKVAPGVDVRGQGGYVIVPPSPGYEIVDDSMPADMPAWLVDLLDPPQAPREPAQRIARDDDTNGSRYGLSALDDECQAIMSAPFGQQEVTLNNAGLKIGALVAGGELSHGYAVSCLISAGNGMPSMAGKPAWTPRLVEDKVRRAVQDGMAVPRRAPPRRVEHTVRVEMVVPPEPPPYDEPPAHWSYEAEPARPSQVSKQPESVAPLELIEPGTWTTPPPPRKWVVDGWIPSGVVSAKYGDGGIGKTLSSQQLMTAVATGMDWLGLPTRRGRALGVFCEDDEDELHRRQIAINESLGISMGDLQPAMRLLSRLGDDNALVHYDQTGNYLTAFHARLMETCKAWRPDLVVLDTAADLYPDNENDRSKVRWFIQAGLARIARDFKCGVLLLAHPSVSGLNSGTGTGGSTAWNNTVRSRLYLSKEMDENGKDTGSAIRILSKKKSNYAAQGGDIRLIWSNGVLMPASGSMGDNIQWPTISAAFDELERAWFAGKPWSSTHQSKAAGRYFPTWAKMNLGVSEKAMADLLTGWLTNGCLSIEVYNTSTKASGLQVLRRPDR